MSFLKAMIRRTLRERGYLIQKYPARPFRTVPVFDLSVRLLMATRGEQVTFVQVGANDGKFGDPLHKYITQFPWRGVLVEPQPDLFDRLRSNYAHAADRLIFENVAIAAGLSELAMYRAGKGGGSGGGDEVFESSVVSASPEVVARQLGVRTSELERFTVPCCTLDDLFRKHDLHTVDVLQVDTEGHDDEVLRTLDLASVQPSIIQFEHGHLSPARITAVVDRLNGSGYGVLYGGHQTDTVALHESFFEDRPPR